jgi:acyl-CoA synthetase (AMP-forming)/AMP-acid ligase II
VSAAVTTYPMRHVAGWTSLVEMMRAYARDRPDDTAVIALDGTGEEAARISYGELDRRCRAVAVGLSAHTSPGDRVLLPAPNGLGFPIGFLGCAYAGVIPVPVPPPRAGRTARRLDRVRAIATDAAAELVLVPDELAQAVWDDPAFAGMARLPIAELAAADPDRWRDPGNDRDTIALLQYTSGSTGDPKGVVLTNGNVLANMAGFLAGLVSDGPAGRLVTVSWLPLFHDMGLALLLVSLVSGGRAVVMSPVAFLLRPALWPITASRYGATVSAAPNFALDLCVARTTDADLAALDLSAWRFIVVGAEPVRPASLAAFAERFADRGLRADALTPSYGLAEATVYVSGVRPGRPGVRTVALDPTAVGRREVLPSADGAGTKFVSCGQAPENIEAVVVDPDHAQPCAAGRIGELWVRGASVGQGYWGRAEATEARFGARLADGTGPFLRTGDLTFVEGGELFVAGRLDDLVIVDGRNHFPQDIEATVEASHPLLAGYRAAAFGYEEGGGTKVAVVAEVSPRPAARIDPAEIRNEVVTAVRRAVAQQHEVSLAAVRLLRPGGLPLTTSGKVRRASARELFTTGRLELW